MVTAPLRHLILVCMLINCTWGSFNFVGLPFHLLCPVTLQHIPQTFLTDAWTYYY